MYVDRSWISPDDKSAWFNANHCGRENISVRLNIGVIGAVGEHIVFFARADISDQASLTFDYSQPEPKWPV